MTNTFSPGSSSVIWIAKEARLFEKHGLDATIIYVTHDLAVVAQMCRRVAVMYAGQVVESAPVRARIEQP